MNRVTTPCLSFAAAVAAFLLNAAPAFAQNLYVASKVGIGTSSPDLSLHVATCSDQLDCVAKDVSLTGGGFAMFGSLGSINLAFDENEIMARNNGGPGELYINKDGGVTQIGNGAGSSTANAPLVIEGGSSADINVPLGRGFIQVGRNSATHLILDNDGIITRSAQGTAQILHLNDFAGGMVKAGGINSPSDASLKTNIEPIRQALEKLGVLRGVSWSWKDSHGGRPRSMGVIAQDVERVFPDIVFTDPKDGLKSVEYNALIGVLVAGVNELADESEALDAERSVLNERVADLETTLDTRVGQLSSENDELKLQLRALQQRMDALELGAGSCAR